MKNKKKKAVLKLNIADEVYRVYHVKCIDKDPKVYGVCDPETHEIFIREGQSSMGYLRTLIHETIHALEEEYKIKIKHKSVHKLEHAIASFIIDNASLLSTLNRKGTT